MNHKARKRFSQNFLTDPMMIQRIIDVIDPKPGQLMIEIGSGQAALTEPLAQAGPDLRIIEIDRDLAARLALRFGEYDNVRLYPGDALELDFFTISAGKPFRLVGNLPYNISTPLLFHVLQWSALITDMHFMLQQEVVDRMAAQPGGKSWGRLSIMVQYHCQVTPLFPVPAAAFSPAPRVRSGFVRLIPHRQPPVQIESMSRFRKLIDQAFSMRRKTLKNSLRGLLDSHCFEDAGIDPGLRPEMLTLEQFAELTRKME